MHMVLLNMCHVLVVICQVEHCCDATFLHKIHKKNCWQWLACMSQQSSHDDLPCVDVPAWLQESHSGAARGNSQAQSQGELF